MRTIWFVSLLTLVPIASVSNAFGDARYPILETVEGDEIVVITTPKGENKVARPGDELTPGDRLRTGPRASAKIRYADGSKILVGKATEIEIEERVGQSRSAELVSGQVRGIVTKPKRLNFKAPPRLMIRTRSAVMGVRGTDFVFGVDQGASKAELRTLEGVVEVAPDQATLLEGKGVRVAQNQFLTAQNGVLSKPQTFNAEAYAEALKAAEPYFAALMKDNKDQEFQAASEAEVEPAETAKEEEGPPRFRFLNFQIGAIYLKQRRSDGELFSFQVSWNPTVRLPILPFTLGGHLSLAPLKNVDGKKFLAHEIGLLARMTLLDPLLLEGGIGHQGWGDFEESGPVVWSSAAWKLKASKWMDRIFVATAVFFPGDGDHDEHFPDERRGGPVVQVKAGVGIAF